MGIGRTGRAGGATAGSARRAAVAGMFYPANPRALRGLLTGLFDAAASLPGVLDDAQRTAGIPVGILVPHAGLEYSGVPAAAAWSRLALREGDAAPLTVVVLGTNHFAASLDGIAAWPAGAWETPLGEVTVDGAIAAAVAALGGPFLDGAWAHDGEHSIEVQLPLLLAVDPAARIVPLAVAAGIGDEAIAAGARLGGLLAERRAAGEHVVLAISSDMAHYPPAGACRRAIDAMLPAILALDPADLARREASLRLSGERGLACGMCGIEPAVVGLAALRSMGAVAGRVLATATSADAGGPDDRTVGYLAVRFDR